MRASIATLLIGLGLLSGCTSSGMTGFGSEASFNKITGNMSSSVESPLDQTYAAAQATLDEMEFKTESKAKDMTKAIIVAKTADQSRVQVTLEMRSEHVTDVTIGVATFGNEARARMVLDKMIEKLKGQKSAAAGAAHAQAEVTVQAK